MLRWVIRTTTPRICSRTPKSTHVNDARGDGKQLARQWQPPQRRIFCPDFDLRCPCAEEVQLHLIRVCEIRGYPTDWVRRRTEAVAKIPATVRLQARSNVQSMHHNFELELSRPRLDVYFLTFCVNHITWHHHSSTIIRCRESFVKVRCQSAAVRIDTRRVPTPSARQSVTSSPCFADQRACLPKQQTTWHGFCPDAAHWTTYFGRVLCLSP